MSSREGKLTEKTSESDAFTIDIPHKTSCPVWRDGVQRYLRTTYSVPSFATLVPKLGLLIHS